STTRVAGPIHASAPASGPTYTKRPSRTAKACAQERCSSTVSMRALRTTSTAGALAGAGAAQAAQRRASETRRFALTSSARAARNADELSRARAVLGDDRGHATRQPLGRRQVQELVRAVSVRLGAEHAGDHELGLGELAPEHAHEGDRSALAHRDRGL